MAYTHTQYEVMMTNEAVITSTGDKARWLPGYIPHVVRAHFFTVTTATQAADAAQLNLDKRPTAGSDTARVNDLVSPLNIPASTAAGKNVYKDGLQAKVSPGEEVVLEVTDATAAGAGSYGIFVEPSWEVPANNTNMALTT
jgi:transcriptional regulator of nitric oxide reductase